jgi:hypothetical protein
MRTEEEETTDLATAVAYAMSVISRTREADQQRVFDAMKGVLGDIRPELRETLQNEVRKEFPELQ